MQKVTMQKGSQCLVEMIVNEITMAKNWLIDVKKDCQCVIYMIGERTWRSCSQPSLLKHFDNYSSRKNARLEKQTSNPKTR